MDRIKGTISKIALEECEGEDREEKRSESVMPLDLYTVTAGNASTLSLAKLEV